MMTDRQLERLLALTHEANQFARAVDERTTHGPGLRLGGGAESGRRRWWPAAALGSLAAGVGLAVGFWMWSAPTPAPGSGLDVATAASGPAPLRPEVGADALWAQVESLFGLALPNRGSVVLAIAQDPAGGIRCVRWTEHAWPDGRALAEVDASELKALAKSMVCEAGAPRIMVVGLEGPVGNLPQSEAMAADVARCILESSACRPGSWNQAGCAASSCMPAALTLRVETLALSR